MNAKLEEVIVCFDARYKQLRLQWTDIPVEEIGIVLQAALATLEPDLTIAEAVRELVSWEKANHFAGMTKDSIPIDWFKRINGIRAAVEKAK